MSFVGPRPALFNQDDLIQLRTEKEISRLTPGITGWAQINGRDDISIPVKVSYDEYYLKNQSFFFDLKILWNTFLKVIKKEGVVHLYEFAFPIKKSQILFDNIQRRILFCDCPCGRLFISL